MRSQLPFPQITSVSLDSGIKAPSASPTTIETRLATSTAPGPKNCLAAHPAVFEAAVVAVPDERWGEVPKALVVLKPGLTATEEELVQHCKANLAAFKVPKSIDFRATLPKGGTGRILKAELREPFWKSHAKRVHQEYNRADRPRLRLIPPRD